MSRKGRLRPECCSASGSAEASSLTGSAGKASCAGKLEPSLQSRGLHHFLNAQSVSVKTKVALAAGLSSLGIFPGPERSGLTPGQGSGGRLSPG